MYPPRDVSCVATWNVSSLCTCVFTSCWYATVAAMPWKSSACRVLQIPLGAFRYRRVFGIGGR
jgi:hypothetical protein